MASVNASRRVASVLLKYASGGVDNTDGN